jgi:hypothetical protein
VKRPLVRGVVAEEYDGHLVRPLDLRGESPAQPQGQPAADRG